MDGSAYARIAGAMTPVVYAGLFALGVALFLGPPAVVWLLAWLLEPRTGVSATPVWLWTQLGWFALVCVTVLLDRIAGAVRERRDATRHAEFMRLRKIFYRDNEVCLESLDDLRRRAAQQAA